MIDPVENTTSLDNAYRAPSSNSIIATNSNHAAEANYGVIDWFKKCLKNYTNFSGRARRKEYWYFLLVQMVLAIIAMILVRRLHDTSRSGWWFWIGIVPLIGSIILLVFLVSDTKPESNQWGAPAK